MENYEKALEYYERALKGYEKVLGTTRPNTLMSVMNIAIVSMQRGDYVKAEELFRRALEGYEAQLGKNSQETKTCATNISALFTISGNIQGSLELKKAYPTLSELEQLAKVSSPIDVNALGDINNDEIDGAVDL